MTTRDHKKAHGCAFGARSSPAKNASLNEVIHSYRVQHCVSCSYFLNLAPRLKAIREGRPKTTGEGIMLDLLTERKLSGLQCIDLSGKLGFETERELMFGRFLCLSATTAPPCIHECAKVFFRTSRLASRLGLPQFQNSTLRSMMSQVECGMCFCWRFLREGKLALMCRVHTHHFDQT